MVGATELPGFGKATECVITRWHTPTPLRFVWHHIQPQEAGGVTEAGNLVQLCDSCHYTIHRIMWLLAHQSLPPPVHHRQMSLAKVGFAACVAAGTVGRIPNEG